MTLAPLSQPFDRERYRTAWAHYEQGRVPYSPALIRRVAEVTGLGPQHRLLDLGCGPGPLSRLFAPLVREVVAMDPTPEMLNAARALAGKIPNIQFVGGSSYDLGPALGRFHLVVMGRSFHWMDRVDTLKRLDELVEPKGAVALFHDTAPTIPANAWRKVWHDICARYEPNEGAHQGPDWIRHEAILLDSPFSRLERFGVVEHRPLDVETIVQRTLSMGSTSPSYLGEQKTSAITAEIRSALGHVREEVVETAALMGWRP
jgi:SAM-dependent methyltransferase